MVAPLAVVIELPEGPQAVTSKVSGLVVKNSSPGGYDSVTFDLPRSLDATRFADAQVRVYDATSGEQVGGGRVTEPGPTDSGVWRISCIGEGIAAMGDRSEPYMVIDSDLSPVARTEQVGVRMKTVGGYKGGKGWRGIAVPKHKVVTSVVSASAQVGSAPDGSDVEGLLFQIPQGTTVRPGNGLRVHLRGPDLCGMELASYAYRFVCGTNSSNWKVRSGESTVGGGSEIGRDDNWTSTETGLTWQFAGTDYANGRNALQLRVFNSSDSPITVGDNAWVHVRDLVLRTRLYGADGNLLPGSAHASSATRVHTVFTDLIVRRCPTLKLGTVTPGKHLFKQLTWLDGATAKEIADELCEADGTVTYHAWEADVDGRTPINMDPVSSKVRYELAAKYGYSAPSPDSVVYDTVIVITPDGSGFEKRVQVSRNTNGRPRSRTIRLKAMPDVGLEAIANQFLDEAAEAPSAGTITVAEPVLDLWTGRMIQPVAVRSGYLCRALGVQPTPDTLNPEAKQDGRTVFRIVSNTYTADSGTSTLELDEPVLDQDRALAALLA